MRTTSAISISNVKKLEKQIARFAPSKANFNKNEHNKSEPNNRFPPQVKFC